MEPIPRVHLLRYRRAIKHGTLTANPARSVDLQKEPSDRPRYLTAEVYGRLYEVIARRFPEHLAEFIVSVKSGMRLSGQYTVEWSQFRPSPTEPGAYVIELTSTKNGQDRTVHLNPNAYDAIRSIRPAVIKPTARMFPREGNKDNFDNRSWLTSCLEEAQITGVTWHTFRHTFGPWLAMAGATTLDIMHAAGHLTWPWPRDTLTCHRHTRPTSLDASPGSAPRNRHQNMHLGMSQRRGKSTYTRTCTRRKWPPAEQGHLSRKALNIMVPGGGLEPPFPLWATDFKSAVSADFTIRASCSSYRAECLIWVRKATGKAPGCA